MNSSIIELGTIEGRGSGAKRVNKTIFLVDDDAAVHCAFASVLGASGYSVKSFPSAESFLEEADGALEGVILLDQCMSGMSGIELHSELTKRDIDLPTIFITGYGDVQTSVKAIKNGAMDFLEKPVSNEALLASINEAFLLLNGHKKYRSSVAEMNRLCLLLACAVLRRRFSVGANPTRRCCSSRKQSEQSWR